MGAIFHTIKVLDRHRYEPEFNPDGTEKHISQDGAYYHVISYHQTGMRCSCHSCEINKRHEPQPR